MKGVRYRGEKNRRRTKITGNLFEPSHENLGMKRKFAVKSGVTYLIERTSNPGIFLRIPFNELYQVVIYCLGRSAQNSDIDIHCFGVTPSGWRIVLTSYSSEIASFISRIHEDISKYLVAVLDNPPEYIWMSKGLFVDKLKRSHEKVEAIADIVSDEDVLHGKYRGTKRRLGTRMSDFRPKTLSVEIPKKYFRTKPENPSEVSLLFTPPPPYTPETKKDFLRMLKAVSLFVSPKAS